jgi:hypothetical protein
MLPLFRFSHRQVDNYGEQLGEKFTSLPKCFWETMEIVSICYLQGVPVA